MIRDGLDLEKGLDDVGGDLETLDVKIQSIQGQVEETIRIGGAEVPNVTSGFGELVEKIQQNEIMLREMAKSFGGSMEQIEKDQKSFESEQMKR